MRRTPVLLVVAGLAGCLPPRDNPDDSNNAPIVVLRVLTQVNGEWVEGSFGRRNSPFRFDTTGSFDKNGRPLTFRWDFDHDPDFEYPADPGGSDAAPEAVPELLLSDFPAGAGGVGTVVRKVRVKVSAGARRKIVEVDLAISNDAPIIDPGDEIVVQPLAGATVTLDPCGGAVSCTSTDVDGDALRNQTWTQVSGDPVTTSAVDSSGRVTFTAPLTEGVLAFRLTADDGFASGRGDVTVRVGPQAWARTDDRLYRFYVEQQSPVISVTNTQLELIDVEPVTGDIWVAGGSLFGGVDVRRFASNGTTLLDSWLVPVSFAESLDASGTGAVLGHADGFSRLTAGGASADILTGVAPGSGVEGGFLLTRTSLYQDTGGAPVLLGSVPNGNDLIVAHLVVNGGETWVASGGSVYEWDGNAFLQRFSTNAGFVQAMAAHPDGGVWVLHAAGINELRLRRVDSLGSEDLFTFPGDRPLMRSEPATRTLWIMDGADLYVRRDVGGVLGDAQLYDAHTELGLAAQVVPDYQALAPDEKRGLVVAALLAHDSIAGTDTGRLAGVHPALVRSRIVPAIRPVVESLNLGAGRLSVDPARGGLWMLETQADTIVPSATHVTAGGVRLAVNAFSETDFGGQSRLLLGPFATSGGGAVAVYHSQLGGEAGVARVDAGGGSFTTIDFSPQEFTPFVSAGNELGICAVGKTSLSTGSPIKITPATGAKVDYGTTLTWDPFHIDAAAISPDGGTCWYVEAEGTHRIVTASGASASRATVAVATVALAADPRPAGGVWRADANGTISRFSGGAGSFAAIATPVTAMAVERVCDNPATAACANIWYAGPGIVVRARSDGVTLQTFPIIGKVTELAVP